MKTPVLGLRVAAIIFAVVSLSHLLRLFTQAHIVIGGWQVPIWASVFGFLIPAALSIWMWWISTHIATNEKSA